MSKITLKPGDYIRIEGMTEEQYHAVAKAFMAAGACGRGPSYEKLVTGDVFGWSDEWETLEYEDLDKLDEVHFSRELTIDQILGTEPDADGWIEWHGGECPVEKGTLVDVRYRDGMEILGLKAGISDYKDGRARSAYNWHDFAENTVIVAYRIHHPKQEEGSMTIEQLLTKANKHAAKAQEHREKAAKHERKADEHEAKRMELVEQARQLMPGYTLEISAEWERDVEEQPSEDMADPTNWKAGDVVEVVSIDTFDPFPVGKRVNLMESGSSAPFCTDGSVKYAMMNSHLKWISRPQ